MRTYPLPTVIRLELEASELTPLTASLAAAKSATRAELERAALVMPESSVGVWAQRVIRQEVGAELDRILDGDPRLPVGVLASGLGGDELVVALRMGESYLTADGWSATEVEGEEIELDEETIAFVASAFREGAGGILLRPWFPLADLTVTAAATGLADLPQGARAVAIVDEVDPNAVLELLAVAPGPKIMRRHGGEWRDDNSWIPRLRDMAPPPMVKVEGELLASVVAQVDEATANEPFSEDEDEDEAPALQASGLSDEHWARAAEFALRMALVAAPTPKGAAGAERLRRYWLSGKGAAKIKWGAPGDWRRCVAQLSKYLGPRARGYCNLMHARKLGYWPNSKPQAPSPGTKARAVAKQLAK